MYLNQHKGTFYTPSCKHLDTFTHYYAHIPLRVLVPRERYVMDFKYFYQRIISDERNANIYLHLHQGSWGLK